MQVKYVGYLEVKGIAVSSAGAHAAGLWAHGLIVVARALLLQLKLGRR